MSGIYMPGVEMPTHCFQATVKYVWLVGDYSGDEPTFTLFDNLHAAESCATFYKNEHNGVVLFEKIPLNHTFLVFE